MFAIELKRFSSFKDDHFGYSCFCETDEFSRYLSLVIFERLLFERCKFILQGKFLGKVFSESLEQASCVTNTSFRRLHDAISENAKIVKNQPGVI